MSHDRESLDRRTNRRQMFDMALIGVIGLAVAAWALFTGRGAQTVIVLGLLGAASLLAAVVSHRVLLRRGRV